jgi:hypothetical protein
MHAANRRQQRGPPTNWRRAPFRSELRASRSVGRAGDRFLARLDALQLAGASSVARPAEAPSRRDVPSRSDFVAVL